MQTKILEFSHLQFEIPGMSHDVYSVQGLFSILESLTNGGEFYIYKLLFVPQGSWSHIETENLTLTKNLLLKYKVSPLNTLNNVSKQI